MIAFRYDRHKQHHGELLSAGREAEERSGEEQRRQRRRKEKTAHEKHSLCYRHDKLRNHHDKQLFRRTK
jgi:hypothetical protein